MAIHREGRIVRPEDRMQRIKGPVEVPEVPHFAVIVYKVQTVHIEGDERSRQCPGHGYPAHDEKFDVFEHWVTTNKDDLLAFVEKLDSQGERYVFMHVDSKGKLTKNVSFDMEFVR